MSMRVISGSRRVQKDPPYVALSSHVALEHLAPDDGAVYIAGPVNADAFSARVVRRR